jgi:hypothetical protein
MGREQMRNLDTSRTGSAQVNEFEYQKNQGDLTEQQDQHPLGAKKVKRPTQAERVKQITAAAHKKVEQRKKKKEAATTGRTKVTKPAAKGTKKAVGKTATKK